MCADSYWHLHLADLPRAFKFVNKFVSHRLRVFKMARSIRVTILQAISTRFSRWFFSRRPLAIEGAPDGSPVLSSKKSTRSCCKRIMFVFSVISVGSFIVMFGWHLYKSVPGWLDWLYYQLGVLQPVDLTIAQSCRLLLLNSVNACCRLFHALRCQGAAIDPLRLAPCARYLVNRFRMYNEICLSPID